MILQYGTYVFVVYFVCLVISTYLITMAYINLLTTHRSVNQWSTVNVIARVEGHSFDSETINKTRGIVL